MVRRVKLDLIDSHTVTIVCLELWRVSISEIGRLEGLRSPGQPAEGSRTLFVVLRLREDSK